MPVIEKIRIAATTVVTNALEIITIHLLPFIHLNKRGALHIGKGGEYILYLGSVRTLLLVQVIIKKFNIYNFFSNRIDYYVKCVKFTFKCYKILAIKIIN